MWPSHKHTNTHMIVLHAPKSEEVRITGLPYWLQTPRSMQVHTVSLHIVQAHSVQLWVWIRIIADILFQQREMYTLKKALLPKIETWNMIARFNPSMLFHIDTHNFCSAKCSVILLCWHCYSKNWIPIVKNTIRVIPREHGVPLNAQRMRMMWFGSTFFTTA